MSLLGNKAAWYGGALKLEIDCYINMTNSSMTGMFDLRSFHVCIAFST